MTVTCFMLTDTPNAFVGLRRYHPSSGEAEKCPAAGAWRYHNRTVILSAVTLRRYAERDDIPAERRNHYFEMRGGGFGVPDFDYPGHDDPRWPTRCGHCGEYVFTEDDPYQEWSEAVYKRGDTGGATTIRDAPDGAMWDAYWMPWTTGPDGRCLVVKCPGGYQWMIDGRASNCTLPDDKEHRCWVRHGEPPQITVDKNGLTCAAGAGSIQAGDYHGFLRDGVFT